MITFSDLTKQVHLINDLILTDMVYAEAENNTKETAGFSRHLLSTKSWFSRISWANKKRFVLALLEDVRSAWTLSLLLKSLWNCRFKDAVLSMNDRTAWSSYDAVPMDHNRTALPTTLLAQVMKSDRLWFLTLEPEAQAMVISELLTVAGGPVMCLVLRRAQVLYERYRGQQLHNLEECVVTDTKSEVLVPNGKKEVVVPKEATAAAATSGLTAKEQLVPGQAQKELETNLAAWNNIIKSMKDTLKLEEREYTSRDGTTRKIWKVNRPKPEIIETVDIFQLLPSAIGKRILSYLPRHQLNDYARINKYWAYIVEEYRCEVAARQKIDADFNKMHETMLRHDTSLELVEQIEVPNRGPYSSLANTSTGLSSKFKPHFSIKASEMSGGGCSTRHFLSENLNKPFAAPRPIRNMAEMTERLDRRGAADDNLWTWCENILKDVKKEGQKDRSEGVLDLGNIHFPCPLMKQCLEVPLTSPLCKDPAKTAPLKPRRNISDATVMQAPREQRRNKRYSLWARDFSGLYPVLKIPSYQYP